MGHLAAIFFAKSLERMSDEGVFLGWCFPPRLYYRASWGLWLLSEGGVHESDVWMGRAYAKESQPGREAVTQKTRQMIYNPFV